MREDGVEDAKREFLFIMVNSVTDLLSTNKIMSFLRWEMGVGLPLRRFMYVLYVERVMCRL